MRSFVLLIILLGYSSLSAQQTEEEQVLATFEGYRTAILNERGAEAVEFLDRRNFEYYQDILEHIRFSDSTTVAGLRFMDQLMILRMRHLSPEVNVKQLTDSLFLIYAIDEGMIGKDGVSNTWIGEIKVTDDFATATIIVDEEETPFNHHFYREDGEWGFDLTAIFPMAEAALQKVIRDNGSSEREFLYLALEVLTGKAVDEAKLWQPLVQLKN